MKTYKGFDKDLKCRGFQYEIGKEYEEEKAKACECGFHACEAPLDVLQYYHPRTGSRYCEVEQDGDLSRDENSKVASTKIKIGAEIGIAGIVKAQVAYIRSKCTNEHNAEPGKAATAGDYGAATAGDSGAATAGYKGAATAGDSGAATAGNYGAATAGNYGAATAGENGIACCRGGKVKGGIGCAICCAELDDDGNNIAICAAIVDGENIKADTWYAVENGKFVEVE